MRIEQFQDWLRNVRGLPKRSIGSRISNCKRLERYEGDLDQHFERDRMVDLLGRLAYSTTDERTHTPPRHGIPITGNVYNGTATLRSAATLYKDFKQGNVSLRRRHASSARTSTADLGLGSSNTSTDRPQNLESLIADGESDRVEFKSTLRTNLHTGKRDQRMEDAVVKTIAAFLNTHGGTLIVGIKDDGSPVGIDKDGFTNEDKMNLHLANLVSDKIGKVVSRSIHASFEDHRDVRVLVVRCERSPTPAYVGQEKTFYIRNLARTVALPGPDLVEYVKQHFS